MTYETCRTLTDEIMGLARRYSTALVLFHHAVGEQMGLGATDHKCLEILRQRGPMTGSQLAAVTGLTTGAITGVVTRLERRGFVRRVADAQDRRKQLLQPVPERIDDIHSVLGPFRDDVAEGLLEFDEEQLKVIAKFLEEGASIASRHTTLLRAQKLSETSITGEVM